MASENIFELVGQTGQGTVFAIRKDDPGVKYIAQPFGVVKESDVQGADKQQTIDEAFAFYSLIHGANVGAPIAQIFNHENIISIAGHVKTQSEEYIVWDYCDASNLSALFQSRPCEPATNYYLHESLCWHVLTSLISAVTYLHDGKRLFLDTTASAGEEANKLWASVDHDWHPILHRAIEPRNIFFQQSRGIETYGLCKLGNFEHAVVTNHVIRPDEEHVESKAMAPYRGFEALDITRQQLLEENRPYTIADDLFAIGSVVYTMMTGQQPSTDNNVNPQTHHYSDALQSVVRDLLSMAHVDRVLPTTELVMQHYRYWKLHTEEGRLYRDIEDDMAARQANS